MRRKTKDFLKGKQKEKDLQQDQDKTLPTSPTKGQNIRITVIGHLLIKI